MMFAYKLLAVSLLFHLPVTFWSGSVVFMVGWQSAASVSILEVNHTKCNQSLPNGEQLLFSGGSWGYSSQFAGSDSLKYGPQLCFILCFEVSVPTGQSLGHSLMMALTMAWVKVCSDHSDALAEQLAKWFFTWVGQKCNLDAVQHCCTSGGGVTQYSCTTYWNEISQQFILPILLQFDKTEDIFYEYGGLGAIRNFVIGVVYKQ